MRETNVLINVISQGVNSWGGQAEGLLCCRRAVCKPTRWFTRVLAALVGEHVALLGHSVDRMWIIITGYGSSLEYVDLHYQMLIFMYGCETSLPGMELHYQIQVFITGSGSLVLDVQPDMYLHYRMWIFIIRYRSSLPGMDLQYRIWIFIIRYGSSLPDIYLQYRMWIFVPGCGSLLREGQACALHYMLILKQSSATSPVWRKHWLGFGKRLWFSLLDEDWQNMEEQVWQQCLFINRVNKWDWGRPSITEVIVLQCK